MNSEMVYCTRQSRELSLGPVAKSTSKLIQFSIPTQGGARVAQSVGARPPEIDSRISYPCFDSFPFLCS